MSRRLSQPRQSDRRWRIIRTSHGICHAHSCGVNYPAHAIQPRSRRQHVASGVSPRFHAIYRCSSREAVIAGLPGSLSPLEPRSKAPPGHARPRSSAPERGKVDTVLHHRQSSTDPPCCGRSPTELLRSHVTLTCTPESGDLRSGGGTGGGSPARNERDHKAEG